MTEAENLQDDTIKHLEDSSEAYLQANLKIIEALNESSISLDMLRDAALTGINQKVINYSFSLLFVGGLCTVAADGEMADQ